MLPSPAISVQLNGMGRQTVQSEARDRNTNQSRNEMRPFAFVVVVVVVIEYTTRPSHRAFDYRYHIAANRGASFKIVQQINEFDSRWIYYQRIHNEAKKLQHSVDAMKGIYDFWCFDGWMRLGGWLDRLTSHWDRKYTRILKSDGKIKITDFRIALIHLNYVRRNRNSEPFLRMRFIQVVSGMGFTRLHWHVWDVSIAEQRNENEMRMGKL